MMVSFSALGSVFPCIALIVSPQFDRVGFAIQRLHKLSMFVSDVYLLFWSSRRSSVVWTKGWDL